MNLTLVSLTAVMVVTSAGCSMEIGGNNAEDYTALQDEVRELRSREEIRELFTDYGRTLDERDFAAFGRLFARDSEFVGGGGSGTASGPEQIAALLERAIMSNPSGVTGANLHVFSNEKIDVAGDEATAISRGAFIGENAERRPDALIYATYRDQLVREDGAWKFKRREVVGDIPAPRPAN